MKRVLVTASHHKMADGIKDTLAFVSGNQPIEEAVDNLMNGFDAEDEVVILTDLTAGSVNQQFFKYRNRPYTHIVSGMNLPLAFQIAMEPQDEYITVEHMREIVEESKNEIKYINDIADDGDDEDE